jgi:hypothetical protein
VSPFFVGAKPFFIEYKSTPPPPPLLIARFFFLLDKKKAMKYIIISLAPLPYVHVCDPFFLPASAPLLFCPLCVSFVFLNLDTSDASEFGGPFRVFCKSVRRNRRRCVFQRLLHVFKCHLEVQLPLVFELHNFHGRHLTS